MEVSGERVTGSLSAGDRDATRKLTVNLSDDNFKDYESLFESFVRGLGDSEGSFKVDGSLLFEFVPKKKPKPKGRLLSPQTWFDFHKIAEGMAKVSIANYKPKSSPALDSYNYQKQVPPLDKTALEEAIPNV